MPQPNGHPPQSVLPERCIPGGDLFFSVGGGGVPFRVHSYFFVRESSYWRDQFAGPAAPGGTQPIARKGKNASDPIVLENDKPEDFDQFLWVFYNPQYGDYSKATLENWITILNYSTKWRFPKIKELAIRHIENLNMDPIRRIRLYKDNDVPETHLLPLYVKLASREQFLTQEEAYTLGLETFFFVHQARERLRVPSPGANKNQVLSPVRSEYKEADIKRIVAATFNIAI